MNLETRIKWETQLKTANHLEAELYAELISLKLHGRLYDFNEIDYEDLAMLWNDEAIADSMIADLFDVSKNKVATKRKEMKIDKHHLSIEKELANISNSVLGFAMILKKQIKEKHNIDIGEEAQTLYTEMMKVTEKKLRGQA